MPSIERNSIERKTINISFHTDVNQIDNSNKKKHRRQRPYMNETGPGDYELPSMTGSKSILAEKKNGPSFSFGVRTKKMQFISKEYLRVRFSCAYLCRILWEKKVKMPS